MNSNPDDDGKYVECRRCCAFNLPAMFIFVSSSADDTEELLHTFAALASDHYYMVRRTVACGIHEVKNIPSHVSNRFAIQFLTDHYVLIFR